MTTDIFYLNSFKFSDPTSYPFTLIVPELIYESLSRQLIKEVLPAPECPTTPNFCPYYILNDTLFSIGLELETGPKHTLSN